MRADAAAALALLLLPAAAPGQQIELRYRATPAGPRVQFIAETALSAAVFGLPSLPDSTVIESSWRTVETVRVLEAGADRLRLRVSLDSSRARARIGQDARSDLQVPGSAGLVGDVVVGSRMELRSVTPLTPGADSTFTAVLAARVAGAELQLPPVAVAPGGGWNSIFRFPIGAHLTAGGRLASPHSVAGIASLTLDSLTPRGSDTLAYLSLDAPVETSTGWIAGEGGMGSATFRGRMVGALVWSTGWNAVVSAATTGLFEARFHLERAGEGPIDGRVILTLRARHRVRS
jgi:hypothetical protein